MSRADFLGLAATCVSALGLSACGGVPGLGDSGLTVGDAYERVRVGFSWWGNDARHQYTLEGIQVFEEKNPDIIVSPSYGVWDGYERRYSILMKSSNEADVMQVNYAWLRRYSPEGMGYYDLLGLSDIIDLSNFSDADLACGMRGKRLNALPIAYNTTCFFYNRRLYEKYGLAIPATWDDLFAAAKLMREDGVYPLGSIFKQVLLLLNAWHVQTTGKLLFDEAGTYLSDPTSLAELLDCYKRFVDEKVMPYPGDFEENFFADGKIAGVACWASDSARYCDAAEELGIEVAMGDCLKADGAQTSWYVKPATLLAISNKTDRPTAAARLLDFLLNDPDMARLQGTEKGVPVSAAAIKALEEAGMLSGVEWEAGTYIRENRASMEMINPLLEDQDIQALFKDAGDKCLFGQASVAQAAEELDASLRAFVASSQA